MKIFLDILAFVVAIGIAGAIYMIKETEATALAGIGAGIAFFLVSLMLVSSFGVVPAGDVGVVLSWSRPTGDLKPNGWYFAPSILGYSVYPMQTTAIREWPVKNAEAATNDLQQVSTDVTLNFHLIARPDSILNVYTNLRDNFDSVIGPITLEAVKATVADYAAQELIDKRSKVKDQLDSLLEQRLAHYGIAVDNVSLTQFQFSDQFNSAIEAKVTQEQASLQAKAKLDQVNYEAKQIVATARAQAQALQLKRQSITETLVEQAAVDKWDGRMPAVMGGGSLSNLPASLFGGK